MNSPDSERNRNCTAKFCGVKRTYGFFRKTTLKGNVHPSPNTVAGVIAVGRSRGDLAMVVPGRYAQIAGNSVAQGKIDVEGILATGWAYNVRRRRIWIDEFLLTVVVVIVVKRNAS